MLGSWYPAVSLRSTAGYRLKSLRDGNQKQGQVLEMTKCLLR
jgi:hypothetical protein